MANFLFFGDSITFGEYDGISGGWVDTLKRFSYSRFNHHNAREVNVFNLGIGGETTVGLMKRFIIEAEARRAEDKNVIFFAYGANDLVVVNGQPQVSLQQYIDNLKWAYTEAKKITADVFTLSIIPVASAVDGVMTASGKIRADDNIRKYNAAAREVAEVYDVTFIDTYTVFYPGREFLLSKDGVHPNAEGYQLISESIRPILEKYL